MKKLILIAVLFASGCSLLPRDHDPVMFGNLVDVKISVDKLSCDDKNWNAALDKVHTLKVYSELRNDPQATSISQLEEALGKARDSSNKLFCESVLKINKTRIDVVADAWKGR